MSGHQWSPERLSGAGVWGLRKTPMNCSRLNEARIQPRFSKRKKVETLRSQPFVGGLGIGLVRIYLISMLPPSAKALC